MFFFILYLSLVYVSLTFVFLTGEPLTMGDIKNFLYAWCGKKKLSPNYDVRAGGNKNRQKFMCEVR